MFGLRLRPVRWIRLRLASKGKPQAGPHRPKAAVATPSKVEKEKEAERYKAQYRSLAHSVLGTELKRGIELEQLKAIARVSRESSLLLDALLQGESLDSAFVRHCREVRSVETERDARRKAATMVATNGPTSEAGRLGLAVLAWKKGARRFALDLFRLVSEDRVLRAASAEYFAAFFSEDEVAGRALVRRWVERPGLGTDDLLAVLGTCLGARDFQSASRVLGVLDQRVGTLSDKECELANWYRSWLAQADSVAKERTQPVSLAFFSYSQPDVRGSSANVGDYVQTLASLGHLLRHRNVTLHGDPALVSLVNTLRTRTPKHLWLNSPATSAELHVVHRDATSFDAVPDGTWLVANGWYMSAQFGQRYDFPFRETLRPLFVSFHVNRSQFLTPAAIQYLKYHAPIGCRDWATTYLLLSAGVDAFFSGCLTTTLDGVCGERTQAPGTGKEVFVDAIDAPRNSETFQQEQEEVRTRPFSENMRAAIVLLEKYRDECDAITTSRLHTYLPARTMGVEVHFQAKNPADVRFEGLIGISQDELVAMRERLRQGLAEVYTLILGGASEDEVRGLWRQFWGPDVDRAKKEFKQTSAVQLAFSEEISDVIERVKLTRVDFPRTVAFPEDASEIHVEVSLDENLKVQLEVVLSSVVDRASRPIHVYVLGRGQTSEDQERLQELFPELSITWFDCGHARYPASRLLPHTTVATLDRLLLPSLVPEVERIVHLDLDLVVLDDVATLYDTPLGEMPLAARSSPWEVTAGGFATMLTVLKGLKSHPEKARHLFKTFLQRNQFDFESFNAGVMVLNLEVLRRDDFTQTFVPFALEFGLHDQDLLNFYAGRNRVALDRRWNVIPRLELLDGASVVHWAGPDKPWSQPIEGRSLWDAAERALDARRKRGKSFKRVLAH